MNIYEEQRLIEVNASTCVELQPKDKLIDLVNRLREQEKLMFNKLRAADIHDYIRIRSKVGSIKEEIINYVRENVKEITDEGR